MITIVMIIMKIIMIIIITVAGNRQRGSHLFSNTQQSDVNSRPAVAPSSCHCLMRGQKEESVGEPEHYQGVADLFLDPAQER